MPPSPPPEQNEEFWIFGYGSLIWKPPPHFDLRVPGYIEGYIRRFWQASEDHRGTPSSPGRVVTLIERSYWESLGESPSTTPARVYGAAYRIPQPHIPTVQSYLDIREINGYSIQYTAFHPVSSSSTKTTAQTPTSPTTLSPPSPIPKCMLYIGLPSNPQFLGKQDPQDVAEVIARSKGPSGLNCEYLFMLEEALEGLVGESGDEHVRDLAGKVRGLMGREQEREGVGAGVDISGTAEEAVEREAERVRSGAGREPVEEAEKLL